MMTNNRKQRLKIKIIRSRVSLFQTKPFFAILLMYLDFIADTRVKTISTNGRCIYFHPDFLDKLSPDEVDYIFCHQVMHILQGDIWRSRELADINYHHACDIVLNNHLRAYGFEAQRYPHIGTVLFEPLLCAKEIEPFTPMNCYQNLMYSLYAFDERTRKKYILDEDTCWDWKQDIGLTGTLIIKGEYSRYLGTSAALYADDETDDLPSQPQQENKTGVVSATDAALKQEWAFLSAAAQSFADSVGKEQFNTAGLAKEQMRRRFGKLKKAQADWRTILNDFVQEEICDYSFAPPDRRFDSGDFFLPDFSEKEDVAENILFMIDTSASMTEEMITAAYSEIKGAIDQFDGKLKGWLGFFDAGVIAPKPFQSEQSFKVIYPEGGGGTDFAVIFNYVHEHMAQNPPASIVIFTDGDAPYPPQTASGGIPVLWLLNNDDVTPPWGKVARIHLKSENAAWRDSLGYYN